MIRCGRYVLVGHEAKEEPDLLTWARWFEDSGRARIVDRTELGEAVVVSTVFLALDHRFSGEGPPILFETMVFGGDRHCETRRCSTWDEAIDQHARVVASFGPAGLN